MNKTFFKEAVGAGFLQKLKPAFDISKDVGGKALDVAALVGVPTVGVQLIDRFKDTVKDLKEKDTKAAAGDATALASRLLGLGLFAGPSLKGAGLVAKGLGKTFEGAATLKHMPLKGLTGGIGSRLASGSTDLTSAGKAFATPGGELLAGAVAVPVMAAADNLASKLRNKEVPNMPGTTGEIEKKVREVMLEIQKRLPFIHSSSEAVRKKEIDNYIQTLNNLKQASMNKEAIWPAAALAWPILRMLGTAGMAYMSGKGVLEEAPQTWRAAKAGDWKSMGLHGLNLGMNLAFTPMMGASTFKNLARLPAIMKERKLLNALNQGTSEAKALEQMNAVAPKRKFTSLWGDKDVAVREDRFTPQASQLAEATRGGKLDASHFSEEMKPHFEAYQKRLGWYDKANQMSGDLYHNTVGKALGSYAEPAAKWGNRIGLAQMALPFAGVMPTTYEYGRGGRLVALNPETGLPEVPASRAQRAGDVATDTFNDIRRRTSQLA